MLLIRQALYGRMKSGRCISDEYAHAMKCHTDVRHYLDEKCSGRQRCHVFVGTLDTIAQPCLKDFKSYLEVKYECVKGESVGTTATLSVLNDVC